MHFKHIVVGFGMAASALANVLPMTAAPSVTSRAAIIELRAEPITTAVAGHCEQFDGVPTTISGSVSRVSQGQVICDSWTKGYYTTRGTPPVNVITTTFLTTVPAKPTLSTTIYTTTFPTTLSVKPTPSVTIYTTTFPVTIAKPTPSVTIYTTIFPVTIAKPTPTVTTYTTTFPVTIAKPTPAVTIYTTTYPSTVLITPTPSVHVYTTTFPTTILVSPTSLVHTITTTFPVTLTTTSPSVSVHTTTLQTLITITPVITPRALPTVSSLNERCNVDELGQTYCVKEERFAKTMATQMTIDMAKVNRDGKALETKWVATQPLATSALRTGTLAPIATWKNPPANYPLVIDYRPATTNQDEYEQGIEQAEALAFGMIVPVDERMESEDERMQIEVRSGSIISNDASTRVSINGWAYWAALGALPVVLSLL